MTDSIFHKTLAVQVKSREKEDRLQYLNLTLEHKVSAAPIQKKYLNLQLTDDSDSFFLYTLRVDEEDFQILKSTQGLLVDFGSFPQKLIELLTLCHNEERKDVPKFILQLMMNDGFSTLNIVETNPFKHLIHLSLKVVPGNDVAVKNFLSNCLREYKEKYERLRNQLESTESSLRCSLKNTEETLAARTAELSSMKLQWESKITELQAKNAQLISNEKEASLKTQSSIQQRYQQEKRDLEQAHMKIVKQLEARVYELDTQNKELTETKFVNDASIRDLTSKLSVSEEEGKKMRQDVQQLRKDNSELDSELHKLEKTISQLHTRIAVLEQQVTDKDVAIANSERLLKAEQAHKKLMEDESTSVKTRTAQLDTNIKTLSDEILKANEIIRKLQQDNKNVQAKLKLRSQIALKQEEVLKDKDKQLEKQEAELRQLRTDGEAKNKNANDVKAELEKAQAELTECHKKLASNENVISWLNKQLDQVQMGRVRAGALLSSSTATNAIHTISLSNTTSGHNTRNNTSSSPKAHPGDSSGDLGDTPGQTSKIPQPKYKSTPLTDNTVTMNKENEQVIDAKYLPQTAHVHTGPIPAAPLMPIRNRNWAINNADPLMPVSKARISKDVVNPHNALVTAYFPPTK